jgi:acetyl esterase/lipase
MRRLLPAMVTALAVVALPGPAFAQPCSGDPAETPRLDLVVAGQPAYGVYALPPHPPRGLVVFGHGYGWNVDTWRRHLSKVARRDGVIAVAMNYRGTIDLPRDSSGFERARGWPAAAGAEDLVAAARHFDGHCPGLAGITIHGVSMGANMTGLAVAARAKRLNGRPLFDYWVAVEGAHNVTEEYFLARPLAPANATAKNAVEDIEREMGGPYETRSSTYDERTNVNRIADMAASGVRGVILVHATADGLVPYDQSVQLARRLRATDVPVDFFTVGRRGSNERDTTFTGYAGVQGEMAGHGSESSETHIVIQTGFDRLNALLTRGEPAPCNRDFQVDDRPSNVTPDPRTRTPACRPDPLPPAGARCADRSKPAPVRTRLRRRRGRRALAGRASDRGCGRVARVRVAVARLSGRRRCRFLTSRRRLGKTRPCRRPAYVRARGRESWRLTLPRRLPRGRYRAFAAARDTAGNLGRRGRALRFRVR